MARIWGWQSEIRPICSYVFYYRIWLFWGKLAPTGVAFAIVTSARPYGSFRLVVTLWPSSSAALLPTHLSSMDTSRSISQVIGCFCVTFMRWRSLLYIIHDDMTFSGEIKSGVPSFHLPPFSFERPVSNSSNSTNPDTEWVTFDTILSDLGMGLAMVPIIAILEQVAIAKAFCELLSSNSQFPFVCFVNEIRFL